MHQPKLNKQLWDGKFELLNPDIDCSFLTIEMPWRGLRVPAGIHTANARVPSMFESVEKGSTVNTYASHGTLGRYISRCARFLVGHPAAVRRIAADTERESRAVRKLARELMAKIPRLNATELGEMIVRAGEAQSVLMATGVAVAFSDINGEVTQPLGEIVSGRKSLRRPVHEYTNTLSTPSTPSLTERAERTIRTSRLPTNLLTERYFWLHQGYIGHGLLQAHVREIQQKKPDFYKALNRSRFIAELALTPRERARFALASELVRLKSLRSDSRQFLFVAINQATARLAKLTGIEERLLHCMHTVELAAVVSGTAPLPSGIRERLRFAVHIPQGRLYGTLVGAEARRFIETAVVTERVSFNVQTLSGQVAFAGKVRGTVGLVFGPQHMASFKSGSVLVCPATSPQVLPAMKRAAAFVTDVGGITSHAAIVSRELKVPCIVGTKMASKILKNGDLVEVDGGAGTVTILKKARR